MNYKLLSVFLLGVLIGVACNAAKQVAVDTAVAAEPVCGQWEVEQVDVGDAVPAGWEPFGFANGTGVSDGLAAYAVRRCMD